MFGCLRTLAASSDDADEDVAGAWVGVATASCAEGAAVSGVYARGSSGGGPAMANATPNEPSHPAKTHPACRSTESRNAARSSMSPVI